MKRLNENRPPKEEDIQEFVNSINFKLPSGFIEFFKQRNGAEYQGINGFLILWPLTDMIELNKEYNVDEYAPGFFIFGSDGGDSSYCIEKVTGYIYEMPFIGMSNQEASFICKSFTELLNDSL